MKSPLAYTTHFWIETWTEEDNKKIYRKWVQYIDATRVGAIGLEEELEVPFNIKTGTKVSVPFKSEDRDKIIEAASRYINFSGVSTEVKGFIKSNHFFPYTMIGKKWALSLPSFNEYRRHFSNRVLVVIEGIPYNLDTDIIKSNLSNLSVDTLAFTSRFQTKYRESFKEFLEIILDIGTWRLDLSIGSLDLSASREDIQYTPRSIENIWQALYELYQEFLEIVKVDLLYNPNFPSACNKYNNEYKNILRFYDFKWLGCKECPGFNKSLPLFKKGEGADLEVFTVSNQGWGGDAKDILQRINNEQIRFGREYPYIVIQDTEYIKFQQFIKHFALQLDNKYSSKFYVIKPDSLYKVQDYIKEQVEILYMTNLVAKKKAEIVNIKSTNKTSKLKPKASTSFRCYPYAGGSIARERADGLGYLFKDLGSAPKEPTDTHYYICEDTAYSNIKWSSNRTDVCKYLDKYLEGKGIPSNKLYYVKSAKSYFNNSNWIDLNDLLNKDIANFQRYELNFFKHYAKVRLIDSQYKTIYNIPTKYLANPTGRFMYEKTQYQNSCAFLESNKQFLNLLLLTSDVYITFEVNSVVRYREIDEDIINDFDFSDELKDILRGYYFYYESFFNNYPLLKRLNKTDTYEYDTDYGDYIYLMEKHLGEDNYEGPPLETPLYERTFKNLLEVFKVLPEG